MSKLLRRRFKEEDLLLLRRLRDLKLKIMERQQPTNIHHPRYVTGGREDETDEEFLTVRKDSRFEVSNLITGMELKIKYIRGLLESDSSHCDDLSKVVNELEKLSKKCDEIENLAGMGGREDETDEEFLTVRKDSRFEVSNLITGMKLKIKYIRGLLESDSSHCDLSKVTNELEKLYKKCDEIENLAGMDITWV
jgi:hypothetical protein